MKRPVFSALYLALTLVASTAVAHDAPKPTSAEQLECELKLAGTPEAVAELFAMWERDWDKGLANRGFMGAIPPNTPENAAIAHEYGLTWWGIAFRLVPTIEAAKANRLVGYNYHKDKGTLYTDKTTEPIYILGEESELGLTFAKEGKEALELQVPPEKVAELLERGAYQITQEGEVIAIPASELKRRISLTDVKYNNISHLPTSGGVNSLSQSGWVIFKQHGIHDYTQWKNTDSAKRLKKLALKLVERGFTIRFNYDYKACLDFLTRQVRSYRESKGSARKTHDVQRNRYSKAEVYDTALARLMNGEGYSAEVYNEKGELVGGEIGFRDGNAFAGDSVFYDETYTREKDGIDGIDLAKIAALALFEELDKRGMPYSDPEMVTPYTASMGGYLVPFPEFRAKIKSGPKELIQLPESYDPRPADYFTKAIADIARRKSEGLGRKAFVSRMPEAGAQALKAAEGTNVVRDVLKVVLVESQAQAKELAATVTNPRELPLFLVAGTAREEQESATEFLKRALAGEGELFFINHPRYVDDMRTVPAEKFLKFLGTGTEITDAPAFTSPNQIEIPAWAVGK